IFVRDQRGKYLAAQPMRRNQVRVTFTQQRREIALGVDGQEVDQAFSRSGEPVVQVDLRVTQDYCHLRPREPLLAVPPLLDLRLGRQELEIAIEHAGALQVRDEPG